ncbi:MAG: NAD(P)/FAD-dependent oxidoreductase, partial [Rhodospirillaceae bacterium]
GDARLAFLQRENKVARLAMVAAERLSPWLACGPLHPGRRRSAVPGVYAIGNAAGEAHPLVGEGISLAIQSAALLCATLSDAARSGQWERAARMYECAWRHAFTPRLRLSACYANMAMRPRWARAITGWLSYMPQLLTLGARWSGKTCGHIFSSAFTATR